MCDPLTLSVAATAVATIGTAVGGYMQYRGQKYQARVADANRKAENAKAADALDRGTIEQQQLARKYSALAGAQRASMAANGVDTGFGSAADLQTDTAQFYREDADTVSRNTMNEVQGIEISAANFGAQSKALNMAATGTLISTGFDVSSTILGGLGDYGKLKAARKAAG